MQNLPIILEDYLNYLDSVRGLSKNTIREYTYDLTFFLRFMRYRKNPNYRDQPIAQISIADITVKDIATIELRDLHAYLAYSEQDEESAARRARKASSVRSFFKYLVNVESYFDRNPAEKLQSPKRKKRHPVYLTLDEALRLIACAADQKNPFFKYRDVAILVTFLTTGIRLSELCSMNVSSIREDHFSVIGKGNKERTVYVTPSCRQAVEEYLKIRKEIPGENALFVSSRKKRISPRAVQHRIEQFLLKAGFDIRIYSTHKLRHTAATLMYREGVDIRVLQKILGHSSVATTQIYTHVDEDLLRGAVNKNPLSNISIETQNEED